MKSFLKDFYSKCNLDVSLVDIPFVYFVKENTYEGFVPGFIMKSITKDNFEDCEKELIEYTKKELQKYKTKNKQLPTFPTKEQIIEDFHPQKIERISFRL